MDQGRSHAEKVQQYKYALPVMVGPYGGAQDFEHSCAPNVR